jgi:hypothetical protein
MTKRKMTTFKPTYQRDPIVVDNPYKVCPFKKHKGKTYQDILETDPGYILWLHDAKICVFPEATLEVAELAASQKSGHWFTQSDMGGDDFGFEDLPF